MKLRWHRSAPFKKPLVAAAGLWACTVAHAVLLDFDGLPTNPGGGIPAGTTVSEDGFMLASLAGYPGFSAFQDGWQSGRGGSNGTTVLSNYRTSGHGQFAQMARLEAGGGALFDLVSIDLGEIFKATDFAAQNRARWYRFDGVLGAGGSVTVTFEIDGIVDGPGGLADFQTFSFAGEWTGLSSVTMSAAAPGDYTYTYFDNIVVVETGPAPAQVPQPATWMLAALALGTLPRRGSPRDARRLRR